MTGDKITHKTEAEYRKVPMLSASDLRQFSTDRKAFFQEKILGEKREEDYNKAILIGNLVHCLLLEPQEFDNKFYMSICEKPPTGLLLAFTEALYKHTVLSLDENNVVTEDFDSLSDKAYVDSEFKISKEAVLKNFTTPNKKTGEIPENYYKQLLEARLQGLEVACVDDITIAEKIVKQLREDEFVGGIFEDTEDTQSFNEQKIEGFEVDGIQMKGMLDRIVVNHKDKTLQIYDLKVVYDPINFMREYYLKKAAYIQGYIYRIGLLSGKLDLGFDYSDYKHLPPIFLCAHSGCFYKPIQYKMSMNSLLAANIGFDVAQRHYPGVGDIIQDILFAQEKGEWNISLKDYLTNGVREISLPL